MVMEATCSCVRVGVQGVRVGGDVYAQKRCQSVPHPIPLQPVHPLPPGRASSDYLHSHVGRG